MSEFARQLIAENKRTRATFLDLGRCGLTELPAEIGELEWLESLTLADWWYEWDGREWHRKKTQNTGDSNAQLTDLAQLTGLVALRRLYLHGTQASDLKPLT